MSEPLRSPAPSLFARHWFLTGPTASGKTAIGIHLSRTLNAEIVSLDSMAVYRGLNIGTAKPTAAEQAAVPHHLIDKVEPDASFSLAEYLELAAQLCQEIEARSKQVLFVGGTPLYLKALLRGVFEGPPADWPLREKLQKIADELGPDELHKQLAAVDKASAERLHPQDTRRVIRALEVYEKTGQSITQLQQQFDKPLPTEAVRVFMLDWPREELYRRIERRVDQMFADGWVEEVRQLLATGRSLGTSARQAVGYREIMDHLQGQQSLAETVELVKTKTRQFAKRQLTWFRSLSECRRIPMAEPVDATKIVKNILESAAANPAFSA